MDKHSNWFLQNPKPFEIALQKLQHFYNLGRNEFSPNFKSIAQKMGPPRPLEVLEGFGGKSKSKAPRAFKFCTKRVPIEVDKWWKIGVDISNPLWDIQIWKNFFLKVPSTRYKNDFQRPNPKLKRPSWFLIYFFRRFRSFKTKNLESVN